MAALGLEFLAPLWVPSTRTGACVVPQRLAAQIRKRIGGGGRGSLPVLASMATVDLSVGVPLLWGEPISENLVAPKSTGFEDDLFSVENAIPYMSAGESEIGPDG